MSRRGASSFAGRDLAGRPANVYGVDDYRGTIVPAGLHGAGPAVSAPIADGSVVECR